MSESSDSEIEALPRCPNCDSVVGPDSDRCLMCGQPIHLPIDEMKSDDGVDLDQLEDANELPDEGSDQPADLAESAIDEDAVIAPPDDPGYVEFVMNERRTRYTFWLAIVAVIIIGLMAAVVLRFPAAAEVSFIPTTTPIPPTITFTPTWTPLASEAAFIGETPSLPVELAPTDTPQPPRLHRVSSGETMFGLGLRYGVSSESIALANGLGTDAGLLVSQEILIPWPTATPPLEPVLIEIGSQTLIADPTDCELYEIKGGDTLLGVASRNRIDFRALLEVNRLTDQSILQPGDEICIPKIISSGVLPPTAGPSPTPTITPPPSGPHLLLPLPNSEYGGEGEMIVLQWAAVKDLKADEYYMIEFTDLTDVDSHPQRAFTRQTSFQVPTSWRPQVEEKHQIRWRVSIVQVTGQREDGQFIYTFGGNASANELLFWVGAVPTPTPPIPTATATLSALSDDAAP